MKAPARQQRGVNVQRAERGDFEDLLRQDQTVSGDDQHLRPRGDETLKRPFVLQRGGLEYFDTAGFGELLDRAGCGAHPPACGPVGLGEDQRHIVSSVQQRR